MATLRKHIPWLVIALLILTVTGQAAAAFVMPCRGTAACCCPPSAVSTDTTGPMTPGMTHETRTACCETSPAQPCDIAPNTQPAHVTHFVCPSASRANGHALAGSAAVPAAPTGIAWHAYHGGPASTGRGDPPLYLVIQTFLC
jgi:hypothetical protein